MQTPHSAPFASAAPADTSPLPWPDPQRQAQCATWLAGLQERFGLAPHSLRLASADASFRRYLRLDSAHPDFAPSLVVMDAPPDKENSASFVHVATLMQEAGVHSPQVLDWDAEHGFLLLTDLGTHTMMQRIDPSAAPPLAAYLDAVDTLIRWQQASRPGVLPSYDKTLLCSEMALFSQWYLGAYRQVSLDEAQSRVLDKAFDTIAQENLSWPCVYVHCDFMPRNLMDKGRDQPLGVLDFQDALYGPITYDIASLVRDAFISWDEGFCLDVVVRYWQRARAAGLPVGDDFGAFYRGVEWMGLQRHLRIAGIFARLSLRDGKPRYLADTPRFIGYIRATCARYRELGPLLRLIDQVEGTTPPPLFVLGRG